MGGCDSRSLVSSFGFSFGLQQNLTINRGSFGHGVPPQISKNQYDVPLPTVEVLVPSNLRTTERVRAAHCHIYLCRLTEILGELLPLVYGLQHKPARETSKKLRQIRTDLDIWEDSLPDWLRGPTIHTEERIYGASSLQLAFLAVKMLVSRVELNVSRRSGKIERMISNNLAGSQQFRNGKHRGTSLFPNGMQKVSRGDCWVYNVFAKR